MGLFSIRDYRLPEDLLRHIFQRLLIQPGCSLSGLKGCVSKDWLMFSNKVKKEWVYQEGISFRNVTNCQTASEAVEFIVKNKLTAANLSEFPDLTDENLNGCKQITGDKLADAFKMLTQLQHLDLSQCDQIKGDELAEALKTLTQLQVTDLNLV
jgi:hypothetical protein